MSDHVSVLDYRWLVEVPEQAVHQLQLLVHDDRLHPELEMDWINAGLAGRLWSGAVLEFYLDHLVVSRPGVEEGEELPGGEQSLVRSILEGEQQLREESCVERIVGTLGVGCDEWERIWREMEIMQSQTLPLGEEEIIEELAVDEERPGDNQEDVDRMNSSEEVGRIKIEEGYKCGCGDDVLEGINAFSGEEGVVAQNVTSVSVGRLLADLYIVSEDAVDIKVEGNSSADEDVVELFGDEIKEENSSYENEEKNYSADNVEIESVIEDDLNCDNKDLDEDKEDLTAEVLLFEVVFKQNDGESVEAILSLDDLKYWAPTLLTKFLQTRL